MADRGAKATNAVNNTGNACDSAWFAIFSVAKIACTSDGNDVVDAAKEKPNGEEDQSWAHSFVVDRKEHHDDGSNYDYKSGERRPSLVALVRQESKYNATRDSAYFVRHGNACDACRVKL